MCYHTTECHVLTRADGACSLSQMLEFRVKYAKQAHEESQKLQPLIKNEAKYDGIMGQLESFVGRHTSAAATSPRLPVRTLFGGYSEHNSTSGCSHTHETCTLLCVGAGESADRTRCARSELLVRDFRGRSAVTNAVGRIGSSVVVESEGVRRGLDSATTARVTVESRRVLL